MTPQPLNSLPIPFLIPPRSLCPASLPKWKPKVEHVTIFLQPTGSRHTQRRSQSYPRRNLVCVMLIVYKRLFLFSLLRQNVSIPCLIDHKVWVQLNNPLFICSSSRNWSLTHYFSQLYFAIWLQDYCPCLVSVPGYSKPGGHCSLNVEWQVPSPERCSFLSNHLKDSFTQLQALLVLTLYPWELLSSSDVLPTCYPVHVLCPSLKMALVCLGHWHHLKSWPTHAVRDLPSHCAADRSDREPRWCGNGGANLNMLNIRLKLSVSKLQIRMLMTMKSRQVTHWSPPLIITFVYIPAQRMDLSDFQM